MIHNDVAQNLQRPYQSEARLGICNDSTRFAGKSDGRGDETEKWVSCESRGACRFAPLAAADRHILR